jgi:hypothetical protein
MLLSTLLTVPLIRPLLLVVALALATAAGTLQAAPPRITSITCDSADEFAKPVQPSDGERVLFGYVGVPPRYLSQFGRDVSGRWRYGAKAGLLVHTGTQAVTIVVPQAWRRRVAINWGDSGIAGVPALRIPPCRYALSNGVWNEFTGGFWFNVRACVPLVVRVGTRSTTVRFGLGKRC